MQKLVQNAQELFGIQLTNKQVIALSIYERELLIWNEKISLTAIRDEEGIRCKHFLDSFSCVLAWGADPPKTLVDIGTGAGFPGIPLKILYPRLKLTLVESVAKKANFCRHIVETLHLEDVNVIQSRAETLGQHPKHRESYDWALARAVAKLSVLSEYLLPLVKVGGTMLAQKGESGPAETHAAENALTILGGHLRQVIPVTLPSVVEERYLVLADKVGTTPSQYPRREGVPAKRAL
ncbi:MAG: 16S rRNA (guanine(527)-N(7))-methyltransferase RsmG [Anaerolineae bacterium]|uniref:Ribosomal RNA small subunit methyltransferase G n=1 Tax=Candidatus Desulfolinea nitratireducens TaxID=2841698 RepID=A0A8J6TET4_9CHLR|nr:16S rRNA (guanine(527)-N(7))-methyltransferase RsmG [Candidatus Desulfolinea nitratireducens]MBL6960745.1 16S rRNA (guanine(527)-N(7))-methyltransferase RsmG [Anaerolineales bacterium]NQU29059.1 16S rRNA (guanine(527)-N(7))-methyltransferase RsmG [Anaerolineae bacterium]